MEQHIRGVFSNQEVQKVGTGTTSRKSIHKVFWHCVELTEGENTGKVEVQPLNNNYIPSGPKRIVERENFLSDFSPEPEFYVSTVFPRMRELNKVVARGERHRSNQEYFSAEMEFNNALKVDEENVRANFGLGLTYLERNEPDKAQNIFNRLVKLEAAFEQEHTHLFNEFGIQLRKNKMFTEALDYYKRALELSDQDENLYHNIARAALENDNPELAADYLLQGLNLNPTMDESVRFLMWLLSKNLLSDEKRTAAVQVLKKARGALAAAQADADAAPGKEADAEAQAEETPPTP